MKFYLPFVLVLILFVGCAEPRQSGSATAEEQTTPSNTSTSVSGVQDSSDYQRNTSSVGQLVYVPVYSHIYQQDRQKTFNLTATLSIRNTDPFRAFTVNEVAYYDSDGQLVQHYLEQPVRLAPLSSTSYVVEERDLRGGVGANFLVSWEAGQEVNLPVIEAVMISTSQQQGISFLSVGRVLKEY